MYFPKWLKMINSKKDDYYGNIWCQVSESKHGVWSDLYRDMRIATAANQHRIKPQQKNFIHPDKKKYTNYFKSSMTAVIDPCTQRHTFTQASSLMECFTRVQWASRQLMRGRDLEKEHLLQLWPMLMQRRNERQQDRDRKNMGRGRSRKRKEENASIPLNSLTSSLAS